MSKNTRTTVRPSARPTLATAKAGDTLRLRDPKTGLWGPVVVGTKKGDKVIARVRAEMAARNTPEATAAREAAKAERLSKAADRQRGNKAAAAWMRENGLVPSGSAWKAVSGGERDVKALRAMNAADGLKAPVAKASAKAPKPADRKTKAPKAAKAPKLERVTEPVAEAKPEAKPEPKAGTKAERKAAKRRSKAARKAYATRVANGTAVRVNGRFVKAGETAPEPVVEAAPVETDEAEVVRTKGKKALFWADLSDVGLTEAQIAAAWKARKANA